MVGIYKVTIERSGYRQSFLNKFEKPALFLLYRIYLNFVLLEDYQL